MQVKRIELDQFTLGYLECALWAMPSEGEPSDVDFVENPGDGVSIHELPLETLQIAKTVCERFQAENAALLEQAYAQGIRSGHEPHGSAGHDFHLTRNGHGAGYWDGDYPKEIGDALTVAAKKYGENDLYTGDDGNLYWYTTDSVVK